MRIWRGYVIASFAVGISLNAIGNMISLILYQSSSRSFLDWMSECVFYAFFALITALPIFAIVCLVAEKRHIQNWFYYTVSGALTGLALLWIGEWLFSADSASGE